jgi:MerR family transcriptional regulator, light-induced transcriptional regulator
MRTLKTREAAALLKVSPNTLRTWERKFGYPKPQRSSGGHRVYTYAEIEALRDALEEGLSVSSAISVASEGLGADVHALVTALASFRSERADRAMEASLALRSMERSIDEVLLPALDNVRRRRGSASTAWAFAFRWSTDWLTRMHRLSPPPERGQAVLIGDASGDELDPSAAYIRGLELLCSREGFKVLSLSVVALDGLPETVAALEPNCIVLAGDRALDDDVARWANAIRSATGALPIVLYLRMLNSPGSPPDARVLESSPAAACGQIVQLLQGDHIDRRVHWAAGRRP